MEAATSRLHDTQLNPSRWRTASRDRTIMTTQHPSRSHLSGMDRVHHLQFTAPIVRTSSPAATTKVPLELPAPAHRSVDIFMLFLYLVFAVGFLFVCSLFYVVLFG